MIKQQKKKNVEKTILIFDYLWYDLCVTNNQFYNYLKYQKKNKIFFKKYKKKGKEII